MAFFRRTPDAGGLKAKPRNNAYTMMLAISLGAMLIGFVFLLWDYSQYPESKPPEPKPPLTARTLTGDS